MTDKKATTESKKLVTAHARGLHISPRKIRLVTNMLKGLNVNDAMIQLRHLNKKGAPMVAKLLRSAVANAQNNFSMDPERLYIKSITADMGTVMRRYFPRARGSAFIIRRKMSHVNVVLEEKKSGTSKSKFALFKSQAKESQPAEASVDQKEATNTRPPRALGRKSEVNKTEEQVKMNKAQNKRRLFNRKAGE